ncbi:hypothetical protein PRIPAC_81068 [Pristionchus pacificus]|uniref:Tyr recombinase domain-containing protein n=1 Tax=Pristionchus pacificus TaxID=54126 RepID=A0A2A6BYW0_PRIPA|nr:hypothetical protein PRIPAC_81068 [Pristionchus pacificus]|eukprot:PDM71017.1 hypothetical protein PRIPAC_44413 [Pristionchus pacificus]
MRVPRRGHSINSISHLLTSAGRSDLADLLMHTVQGSVAPSTLTQSVSVLPSGSQSHVPLLRRKSHLRGSARGCEPSPRSVCAKCIPKVPTPDPPPSHLRAICEHLDRSDASRDEVRMGSFVVLSMGALLRVSEATALLWEDVTEEESPDFLSLTLFIKKAKNDQERKGASSSIRLSRPSTAFNLWIRFKSLAPSPSPSLPVFHSFSTHKPLSSSFFNSPLDTLCDLLSLPRFSPHSLRVAGVSASVRQGASIDQIRARGRWQSLEGLSPYLRNSKELQGEGLVL